MATVCTVLLPGERPRLEAAGEGCFTALHVDSCREAEHVVRDHAVDALVLSVHRCRRDDLPAVRRLVQAFPAIRAVALLSRYDPEGTAGLLQLGAHGVRLAVDCTVAAGWRQLRELVGDAAAPVAARILERLAPALGVGSPALGEFFAPLVRRAPEWRTLRRLACELGLHPTTLRWRFARAGLPSPRTYLVEMRLLHAAYLLRNPGTALARAVYRLDCASPQGFVRHLRRWAGVTVGEFRRRFPFERLLARYVDDLITPYRGIWRGFSPASGDVEHGPAGTPGSRRA